MTPDISCKEHQFNIPISYEDEPLTVDWRCGVCGKGWQE